MSQIQNHFNSIVPIKRIAAIDLGTNSFHVVIVDIYSDRSFRRIDDLKEMVELAKGGVGKQLADDAFERGIAALKKIKVLCDSYEVEKILAYATSAIREAENGGDFIQRSIDEVGIKIHAIPGSMEAELIGYAVQHGIKLGEEPSLLVDIGGGSVEFIIANKNEFKFLTSLKIGVSRMADIFQPAEPISAKDIERLEKHYTSELKEVGEALGKYPTQTIIGSSGTMQTIALMIAARRGQPSDIMLNELAFSEEEFFDFEQMFLKLNPGQRRKVPGMDERRISFINTGVVLVGFLLRKFGMKEIKISTSALREGIIIRYLKKDLGEIPSKVEFGDPRRRSVFELARKCNWHEVHSRHVTKIALILFDSLQADLNLNNKDRELLEYAALLHDIGYHIAHTAHHKHALYLIRNASLKGFTQNEIEVMAHVARYHRRSTPKKRHTEFSELTEFIKSRIKRLSAILRVADGLDRSHYQNVQNLNVEVTDTTIDIQIQTIDEPNLEIWGAMRKSLLLTEVSEKEVIVRRVNRYGS